jgi:hypothetical protein
MKYTIQEKEQIIKYYNIHGISKTIKKFQIGETTLRRWTDPIFKQKAKQYNKQYKIKRSKIDPIFKEKLKQTKQRCTKILNKNNYKNNKEYREHHLKRCHKYYKNNKKEISKLQKAWLKNNKEKKKLADIQYRENNKEHLQQCKIKWIENNKERLREYRSKTCFKNQKWRFTKQYDDWRKNVYIRDQHICQKCGITKCKIIAHHINEGSKYPELRYDINNGITLCRKCHKIVHHWI